MSFSSIVKNEICRLEINDDCCLLAELASIVRVSGTVKYLNEADASIRIVTENAAFARRIFSIVKKLFNVYPEVIISKSRKFRKHISYIIVLTSSAGVNHMLDILGIALKGKGKRLLKYFRHSGNVLKKSCCKKTYLRGAFLAGGSISDPEKTYHLEIMAHNSLLAFEICKLVNSFKLNGKIIRRKGNYVVYLKEGENIVDFLNIIGAHSALLEIENIRILKGMRNNVNRIVNCETANLEKTVNASLRQIDNIKYIRDNIGFSSLPENLREIAEIRLDYTDANLKELGQMLNPPLGKSGVNHRLRKLDKIAEYERILKGEL